MLISIPSRTPVAALRNENNKPPSHPNCPRFVIAKIFFRMLRELLNELDSMNPINDINCIENRLSELRRAYKINLTIFRQSYTNVDSIIEHVLHTNLHMNSDQRLQFAFALHINAFVCNILSVSIAIASLSPLSS